MTPSCDDVRTSLSALLDGEEASLSRSVVDRHVLGCDDCTVFAATLPLLEERVAAFRALPVPDGTADVLAAAGADRARRPAVGVVPRDARDGGAVRELRWLLGLAAVVQVVVALAALAGVGDGHTSRDLAVLELAMAGGLAAAVWRPVLAAGVLPVVAVGAVAGVVASVGDLLVGASSVATELSHLVLLVATWPLVVLARRQGHGGTVEVA